MTGDEFAAIRKQAGLSVNELGDLLRIADIRGLRKIEDGAKDVSGPVSLLMEILRDGGVAALRR